MGDRIFSLNLEELDVQELERRLELSMAVSDAGVYGGCDTDCPDDCPKLVICCDVNGDEPT